MNYNDNIGGNKNSEFEQVDIGLEHEEGVVPDYDLRDFIRLLQTSTVAPTDPPRNIYNQIQIVVSGGNASLYVYDVSNNKWRASTLGT